MSRRILAVLTMTLLVVLLGSLLAACGEAKDETAVPTPDQEEAAPVTLDGKALLEERCTRCHDLGRVERARKTEEEWKATVERMVEKGARLSQAEQGLVIQYLTETYPNNPPAGRSTGWWGASSSLGRSAYLLVADGLPRPGCSHRRLGLQLPGRWPAGCTEWSQLVQSPVATTAC